MKKPLAVIILVLLVLSAAGAQEKAELTPALFLLKKDNAVLHIFGSIHVGTPDMYPLPSVVTAAFEGAGTLVVELDILEVSAVQAAGVMRKSLGYPQGDSLEKHLAASVYAKLTAVLEEYHLPTAAVIAFKPVVADMILTQVIAAWAGYDSQYGIDVHFLQAAKAVKKPIAALETMEEQFDALGRIPDDAQELMLSRSLADSGDSKADLERLVKVWKTGDMDGCYAIEEKDLLNTPGLESVYEILIAQRNRTMAARLKELAVSGGNFFVVAGVGHFAGPDSVIEILRREGYSVERPSSIGLP
jgi:uncharacterized protein YbaP (TraB family)